MLEASKHFFWWQGEPILSWVILIKFENKPLFFNKGILPLFQENESWYLGRNEAITVS